MLKLFNHHRFEVLFNSWIFKYRAQNLLHMRNLLIALLLALSFMSCENEEPRMETTEATILGRWVPVGFETGIRYEFTANKRFTIYSDNGTFPTLEEFMTENPQLTGNDWVYEGETIVVDLNFGNYSRLVPTFKCGNFVVDLIDEEGNYHSSIFRESHDITTCE